MKKTTQTMRNFPLLLQDHLVLVTTVHVPAQVLVGQKVTLEDVSPVRRGQILLVVMETITATARCQ